MKFIAKYFASFYIVKIIFYTLLPRTVFPFKSLIIAIIAYLVTHFVFSSKQTSKHYVRTSNHQHHDSNNYHNASFDFSNKDLSNVKKAKTVK